jgi:putative ABC transport system permease protein
VAAFWLRSAFYSLYRSKRFALTAILALAVGISSVLIVFSTLDAVLLRPANYAEPESVVELQAAAGKQDWDHVSASVFERVRARTDLFSEAAAARMGLFTVTNVAAPDQVFGLSVAGDYFRMLGARALLGRLLSERDEKANGAAVAVLSYRGWKKLFAGDPKVAGKAVSIDGARYAVAGVLTADFVAPGPYAGSMIWVPLRLGAAEVNGDERNLQVVARLRGGVNAMQANAAVSGWKLQERDERLRARSWSETSDPEQRLLLWLAMAMTMGLLAIGCANLCSLILARGIGKRGDYAVSLALGATRAI